MSRVVSGTLISADGTALTGVPVQFRPMAISAYTTGSSAVSLQPVVAYTDTNGQFSVTLFTEGDFDSSASEYIHARMGYRLEMPTLGMTRFVIVPDGSTEIDWSDLEGGLG